MTCVVPSFPTMPVSPNRPGTGIFGEPDLMRNLAASGFEQVTVKGEDYPRFGIFFQERWSLPILARRKRLLDQNNQ